MDTHGYDSLLLPCPCSSNILLIHMMDFVFFCVAHRLHLWKWSMKQHPAYRTGTLMQLVELLQIWLANSVCQMFPWWYMILPNMEAGWLTTMGCNDIEVYQATTGSWPFCLNFAENVWRRGAGSFLLGEFCGDKNVWWPVFSIDLKSAPI
jgi:hypothetical protein